MTEHQSPGWRRWGHLAATAVASCLLACGPLPVRDTHPMPSSSRSAVDLVSMSELELTEQVVAVVQDGIWARIGRRPYAMAAVVEAPLELGGPVHYLVASVVDVDGDEVCRTVMRSVLMGPMMLRMELTRDRQRLPPGRYTLRVDAFDASDMPLGGDEREFTLTYDQV